MAKFGESPPALDEIADDGGMFDDVDPNVLDEPEEPEPEEAPDPYDADEDVEEAAEEEEPLLAGKYQSVEELEKAYLEAQTALGRNKDEIGKLRDEFADFRAGFEQPPEEPDDGVPWYDQLDPAEINAALETNPGLVLSAIVEDALARKVEPRLAGVTQSLQEAERATQRTQEVDRAYAQVADFWERNPQLRELEADVGEYFNINADIYSDAMFSGDQEKIDRAMIAMTTMALNRNGATSPRAAAKGKARTAPVRGNRTPKTSNDPVSQVIKNITAAVKADGDLYQ